MIQKNLQAGLIALMLLLVVGVCSAKPDSALPKLEVEKLVIGNTLKGHHLTKSFKFALYIDPNGTLKEDRKGSIFDGKWSVDKKGRFCWSYNHKEKTWCRWIKENGDGTYRIL